jgi:hypothetical protein
VVNHCVSGQHYVTQAPGCGNISYFNLHAKGGLAVLWLCEDALFSTWQVDILLRKGGGGKDLRSLL